MNTSGDRLKALLQECGLTPSDFAAQRRVTPQHVNNWFRRGIPLARLDEIADLFCVHRRWLRCGEGPKHPSSILRVDASSAKPASTHSLSKPDGRLLQIPFHDVREGRLAALDGHCLRLPAQALKALGVAPDNAVSLAMPASNMTPWLPREAILAVDLSQTRVVDGEIYALLHNGVLRVNSLSRGHNDTLCLHSNDRHNFPVERYTRAQRQDQRLALGAGVAPNARTNAWKSSAGCSTGRITASAAPAETPCANFCWASCASLCMLRRTLSPGRRKPRSRGLGSTPYERSPSLSGPCRPHS